MLRVFSFLCRIYKHFIGCIDWVSFIEFVYWRHWCCLRFCSNLMKYLPADVVSKTVEVVIDLLWSWRIIDSELNYRTLVFLMAQQAGYGARTAKNPLGIMDFWPSKCTEAPMLWEHWTTLFYLGGNSETGFQSNGVLFRSDVDVKNHMDAEQTLISYLYLCLG